MIIQVALPLALAFIMFSMGLTLSIEDFKKVSRFPKAFIVGLVLQMVALPLTAFALGFLWLNFSEVNPAYLVGFVILAACPGGVTSNMFTHLSKGDTALSISLTAIISVLSFMSIPFLVNLGLDVFASESGPTHLPLGKTIVGVFLITTLPVILGMAIHKMKPVLASRIEPKAKKLAAGLFLVIILAAIFKEWQLILENSLSVGPITVLLNLLTMGTAFWVTKALGLAESQRRAVVFECGLQNGTLAITIAVTFLNNEAMMIPAGLYSLFMFFSGGGYFYWLTRKA